MLTIACLQAMAGVTARVSLDSAGGQGTVGGYSDYPDISADGRYVAFASEATNLVSGDTNDGVDIFVHDRHTGQTERVSVSTAGGQSNGASDHPAISADGRFVTFYSEASNLVVNDTNDEADVFLHDRHTGVTERVSVGIAGAQSNGWSSMSDVSGDGRYVAYVSYATNLVADDTNNLDDVFIRDRWEGVTRRVNVSSSGEQANAERGDFAISDGGRYVTFGSLATNLTPDDTNDAADVFVHDLTTGVTTRVSLDSAGKQATGHSGGPSISADGRYVAFYSDDSNLVADDTNNEGGVFVHDRTTGSTVRVSVNSHGEQANAWIFGFISADGRSVVLTSYASNLVPGDSNDRADVFVHELESGSTSLVSLNNLGAQTYQDNWGYAVSADGRFIAFSSYASNLVPSDTNNAYDVFVHDRRGVLLEGPAGAQSCADGLDNDGDGGTDAADVDCAPITVSFCWGFEVTLLGTSRPERLVGSEGPDVISGLGGNDTIEGRGGDDVICGGDGNDVIGAGDGYDLVFGGRGVDLIQGGEHDDILYGEQGADTLSGGNGFDILKGGTGNDVLHGDADEDLLQGGAGDDTLYGGDANDRLNGGLDTDICDGQAGTDKHSGGCESLLNAP